MKKYLKMLSNIGLYTIIYYAVISSVVFLYFNNPFYSGLVFKGTGLKDFLGQNSLLILGINDVIQLPLFFFLFWKFKKQRLSEICNFSKPTGQATGFALVIGASMGLFTVAMLQQSFILNLMPRLKGAMEFLMGNMFIVFFLCTLINQTFKEVLFRGIIYNEFRKALPIWLALIFQGLIYWLILWNDQFWLQCYGFFGSLVVGLIYTYGKSIWTSIIAQYACSGTIQIFFRTQTGKLITPENSMFFIVTAFSIIIIGLVCFGIIAGKKRSLVIETAPVN